MTSNAGSRELSAGPSGSRSGAGDARTDERRAEERRSAVEVRCRAVFSPEFRNRLDAIVTFKPLSPVVMETIVEKFILQLEAQLAERRIAITLEPEARAWLGGRDSIRSLARGRSPASSSAKCAIR